MVDASKMHSKFVINAHTETNPETLFNFGIQSDEIIAADIKKVTSFFATVTAIIPPYLGIMGYGARPEEKRIFSFEFQIMPDVEKDEFGKDVDESTMNPVFNSYLAQITNVDGAELTVNQSLDSFRIQNRQRVALLSPESPLQN